MKTFIFVFYVVCESNCLGAPKEAVSEVAGRAGSVVAVVRMVFWEGGGFIRRVMFGE